MQPTQSVSNEYTEEKGIVNNSCGTEVSLTACDLLHTLINLHWLATVSRLGELPATSEFVVTPQPSLCRSSTAEKDIITRARKTIETNRKERKGSGLV